MSDFRFLARQIFLSLQSLCQLTAESIEIGVEQFYSTNHITDVANDAELLELQLNGTVQQFITFTTNQFLFSLRTIGNMTQVNTLLSGLLTNAYLSKGNAFYTNVEWLLYGMCSCQHDTTCTADAVIYLNDSLLSPRKVPGFYGACLILEAVRQSDLRCFFNQTCLDEFNTHFEIDEPFNLTHLDLSILRRFDAETTVGAILDELMVDEWQWNISHASYYDCLLYTSPSPRD